MKIYAKNLIFSLCEQWNWQVPSFSLNQLENRNAVAYDCCDVTIILRQLKSKKSQSTNTFHNEQRKGLRTDVRSRKQKERQNQIMKFKASVNVHFVYSTSLLFGEIGRFYPKDQE